MNSIMTKLFNFFLFSTVICSINAQELGSGFQKLTLKNGLSNNDLLCITQDSKGFMWFGTHNGLNKFDGYKFTVFRKKKNSSNSLSDNIVRSVGEDSEGNIWLGTNDGGLNKLNTKTGEFSAYIYDPENPQAEIMKFPINSFVIDKNDMIWLAAGQYGLIKFDKKTENFSAYLNNPSDNQSLISNGISALYINKKGEIIAGAYQGLSIFNEKNNNFENYSFSNTSAGNVSITAIYQTSDNDAEIYWLATSDGLLKFNRNNKTFEVFRIEENEIYNFQANNLASIVEDNNGVLWIGTPNGIAMFNPKTNTFYPSSYVLTFNKSLIDKKIIVGYVDDAGIIWLSIDKEGILKYDAQINKFNLYKHDPFNPLSLPNGIVQGGYQNEDLTLWIATSQHGLTYLDENKNRVKTYNYQRNSPDGLNSNNIKLVFKDSKGNLWIGTNDNGLNRVLPEDINRSEISKFIKYEQNSVDDGAVIDMQIQAIFEDSKGRLWIGTMEGLDRFDYVTEKFIHYSEGPNNKNSLVHKSVQTALKEDKNGNLWIGTWGGLSKMDVNDLNNIKHYHYKNDPDVPTSISGDRVISNYIDKNGNILLGTYGNGLNMLSYDEAQKENTKEAVFIHYTEEDGLAHDVVYTILGDDEGNLWLGTNNGLSKFNPETKTFTNYYEDSGLQGNEFFWGSAFKGRNGELFFGGANGLNSFFPREISTNQYKPPVVLTDFQIFNESVEIGEEAVLQRPIYDTKHITHKHKLITFEFAALHYSKPENNIYEYTLEGFDNKWHRVNANKRFATYTNLDAGDYIFKVRATNSEGFWNDKGSTLSIKVLPPWWATWWFRGTMLFLIISAMVLLYKLRTKQLKQTQKKP
jgi:ligand-binding sensor domain-containing protein